MMKYKKDLKSRVTFKGLNIKKLFKLIKYINKYNSWKSIRDLKVSNKRKIKYYTITIDTRLNKATSISFYRSGKEPKVFNSTDKNFKKHIYAWLVEDIS